MAHERIAALRMGLRSVVQLGVKAEGVFPNRPWYARRKAGDFSAAGVY